MPEKYIFDQIPDFEIGAVEHLRAITTESVLDNLARSISDILSKWNTNVAFFSLTGSCDVLKARVNNSSAFARLYTVNQKNPDLNVILRKAQGMVNRQFVRAIVIEGVPGTLDTLTQRRLEDWAKSHNCTMILGSCVDISYFDELLKEAASQGN